MKALIGTKNPGKVKGATDALTQYFENVEVIGVSVPSNVPDQPVNEETFEGARNRVNNLVKYAEENNIEADFFLGIESGLCNTYGTWQIMNFAVIKDKNNYESVGTSASFPVPNKYIEDIKQKGFGPVVDSILNTDNIRNSVGGISYLTHEKVSRIDLTKEAFLMALTPFINGEIWKD